MTAHPIDTVLPQLLDQLDQAEHAARLAHDRAYKADIAWEDEKRRADRAEHRIARLEAQTSIRGRAVVYARERTREAEAERDRNLRNSREAKKRAIRAEARIKAARDVLDAADDRGPIGLTFDGTPFPAFVNSADIRRALDG